MVKSFKYFFSLPREFKLNRLAIPGMIIGLVYYTLGQLPERDFLMIFFGASLWIPSMVRLVKIVNRVEKEGMSSLPATTPPTA